ncbi:DUF2510 domain-containing protein [Microbacterium oleivorans]|uniref:DUF2510 domain-containing protein n=1 Tax=Microbacterium oleivorans TaxID=273677 RepID=UPI00203C3416|nr:DUF2510 domain-containing protein [Microbacterium oleivorans]MCM3697266.1 DUF2510 domain-containing protein [Microbacterium oleivorans]
MSRQAPAGWYPDPGEPDQLRWWDGTDWASDTVAPRTPVAVDEAAPPPSRAAAPAAAPAAPAAPAEAPAPAQAPAPTATPRPGTAWIWAAIVASALPLYTGSLVDGEAVARLLGQASTALTPAGWIVAGLSLLLIVDLILVALAVLFARLDHRALRRRGIASPFGWGWATLAFVVTLGVYVVGRTFVVHRATGRGIAPFWGWLIATILGLVVFTAWIVGFSDAAWETVTTAR